MVSRIGALVAAAALSGWWGARAGHRFVRAVLYLAFTAMVVVGVFRREWWVAVTGLLWIAVLLRMKRLGPGGVGPSHDADLPERAAPRAP